MRLLTVLLFGVLILFPEVFGQKKMVCYWIAALNASSIDASICTHIVYTFLGIEANGDLNHLWRTEEEAIALISQLNKLKSQKPDLKVMASVGGANDNLVPIWSSLAASSVARNHFADNLLNFVRRTNLNGIDIDWEFPNYHADEGFHPDHNNFILMLETLKQKLGTEYILSVAIGAGPWRTRLSYPNIQALFDNSDFVNLMSYDLHGDWVNKTGLHTALFSSSLDPTPGNVDASVQLLINAGAPRDKIIVGMASYGRAFYLTTSSNGVGAPALINGGAGTMTYFDICQNTISGTMHYRWDDAQKVPYAFKGNYWIGYDDVRSIIEKSNYIKSHNLGGGMFWALDNDDHENLCKGGKFPLISAAYRIIVGV